MPWRSLHQTKHRGRHRQPPPSLVDVGGACSSVLTSVFEPSPKFFSRRLPIVPVDSSLARRPLPGAASCRAVFSRDCAMIDSL